MLLSHQGFTETLPPGPLVRHLQQVYAVTLHLYGQTDPSNEVAVKNIEYNLREIARYTHEPPEYRIPCDHPMPERYDARLLAPQYEMLSHEGEALSTRINRAFREVSDRLRKITEPKTPEEAETRAKRRYAQVLGQARLDAKKHLDAEVRRVRKELGLDNQTGA